MAGKQSDLSPDLIEHLTLDHRGVGRRGIGAQPIRDRRRLPSGSRSESVDRALKAHPQDQRLGIGVGQHSSATGPDVGHRILNRIFRVIGVLQHAPGDVGHLPLDALQMLVQFPWHRHMATPVSINGGDGLNVYRDSSIMRKTGSAGDPMPTPALSDPTSSAALSPCPACAFRRGLASRATPAAATGYHGIVKRPVHLSSPKNARVKENGDEPNRRAVRQEIGVERRALRKTQVYALPHPLHMPRIVGSIGRDCERVSRC